MKPVQISWLPNIANQRLTALLENVRDNWHTYKHGNTGPAQQAKERMITGVFGAIPEACWC